jgi:UDP-N-acetylmuramoyl-L-alanyl-D-glutamate--2,6-diaminopimelate ligase
MGEIATRLSEHVILTNDNPRTEDPGLILREIEAGIQAKNYEIIPDRRAAIRAAIKRAKPGDMVLIAGKGHEDYQIIGTEKKHFDDREEARSALTLK